MARQRRGGGFRPPELRGTLGTLLRTAIAQAGPLRNALERGAREGRERLDSALSGGRRREALAELGEIVLDLVRRGEIDLDELPEARDIVAHLDEIDAGHDDDHDEQIAAPPARNRFDSRRKNDDDGTVSSSTWSRPKPASPAGPRVWRPPVEADRPADEITARERPAPRRSPERRPEKPTTPERRRAPAAREEEDTAPARPSRPPAARKDPLRKGGISFDDDDDLAEYMHPDDVPPKGGSDTDS